MNWADVLRNSSFSVNGRGWVNLDCFRLYESTVNGAIPIVVRSREELTYAFGMFQTKPPWVFAGSWPQARDIVEQVLKNQSDIRERQILLLKWWESEILHVQSVVNEVVGGLSYVMRKHVPHTISHTSID